MGEGDDLARLAGAVGDQVHDQQQRATAKLGKRKPLFVEPAGANSRVPDLRLAISGVSWRALPKALPRFECPRDRQEFVPSKSSRAGEHGLLIPNAIGSAPCGA